MEPFTSLSSRTVVLPAANIDTDQIIPARFLTTSTRAGLGEHLFADWRYLPDGTPRAEFVLNRPEAHGCRILLAGRNFGCGSSREHAPWALADYGFRAIIAPSFADIFANNCLQNGLLPVALPEETVTLISARAQAAENYRVTVDLERCIVSDEQGLAAAFALDEFRRHCLLNGLDDIGLTLRHEADIAAYEARRPRYGRAIVDRS